MEQDKMNLNEQNEELKEQTSAEEAAQTPEETPVGTPVEEAIEKSETIGGAKAEPASQKKTDTPDGAKAESASQKTAEPPQFQPVKQATQTLSQKGRGNRIKRGGVTTLMTVIFVAVVVVLNVLVSALTERFPSMDFDLTAQKLNTLSDQALEVAKSVENETHIYLIGSEEAYMQNRLGASYAQYGMDYSQVATLAQKLQEANRKIHTEFIDPDANPKFISDHAEDGLTSGCVLLETEARHRVLDITDLFAMRTNQTTYQTELVSQVDSALAGALEQVNMQNVPLIAVATGHNEMLTTDSIAGFVELMERQNFEVREFNLLTEEIPEETQVLMIPTPQTDYTTEEIEKLHAYLDDETSAMHKTILATFHTTQEKLPKLESFLEEWGFSLSEGMVAETDASRMMAAYPSFMLVNADQNKVLTTGEYRNLAIRESRPMSLLFSNNNNIAAYPLWTTADSAYAYVDESSAENPETGVQIAAAMADTYKTFAGDNWRRSVIVFGTSFVFTDSFINASAYGDANYIRDLLQYATGTDGSQVSVQTKQVQTLVRDVSASQSTVVLLGLGVFTIGIPLLIVIFGLVVFLRRRHL